MYLERKRASRHQFIATIELTDMQSEKHISGHTKDLSLFGCFVDNNAVPGGHENQAENIAW